MNTGSMYFFSGHVILMFLVYMCRGTKPGYLSQYSDWGVGNGEIGSRFPIWAEDFLLLQIARTATRHQPASYSVGSGTAFPARKVARM
jgi:hypothetical protein